MVTVKSHNIELDHYQLIDAHCHPFSRLSCNLTQQEFLSIGDYFFSGFSNIEFLIPKRILNNNSENNKIENGNRISGTLSDPRYHLQHLFMYKKMIHELATFLGCAPNLETLLQTRNNISRNYPEYIKRLFYDAKIKGLNVDDGFSELVVHRAIPNIDIDDFKTYVPAKVVRTSRIEPLFQRSLDQSSRFEDMESEFLSSLEYAVKSLGAKSLKSIIAYRSGLKVLKTEIDDARKDFKKYKSKSGRIKGRQHLKNLRNYMIWNAIKKSIDLDVPFLFHTGIGDQDIILEECNPANLWSLLTDEELRHAKICLCHAGYPFLSESTFLTAVLPNVYLDLSIVIPLSQCNPNRINQVLEMAPTSKIMYASDVYLPEMYWLSAKIGKRMVGEALSKIVDLNILTEDEAYKAAESILSGNAKRLYRL